MQCDLNVLHKKKNYNHKFTLIKNNKSLNENVAYLVVNI